MKLTFLTRFWEFRESYYGQYSDHDVKGQTFVSDKEAEEVDITKRQKFRREKREVRPKKQNNQN